MNRRLSRRRFLHEGASAWLAASVWQVLHSGAQATAASNSIAASGALQASFGRAKSVIYLHERRTVAVRDVRSQAGCSRGHSRQLLADFDQRTGDSDLKLLPRTAQMTDKLAIVRSFATDDPSHESAGYWINTGHKYVGPDMRALAPTDWPTLGSIIKMLKPTDRGPFSAVMLPEPIIANPNVFLPGQNAGFLGRRWDPEILKCDPSAADFRIEALTLPDRIGRPLRVIEGEPIAGLI